MRANSSGKEANMYAMEFVIHLILDVDNTQADNILKFLLNTLVNEESEKAQALLCIGMAKLMLSGIVSDDRVCPSPAERILLNVDL
jgi:Nuclear condensing complex subunits, C-term domain